MELRLGTRIVIDEEKVLREDIYDLDEMYAMIDRIAKESGLIKKDKTLYVCKGDERDMTCMGIFNIIYLAKEEWFTKNVKQWEWIENGRVDDLIAVSKKHNEGVWE